MVAVRRPAEPQAVTACAPATSLARLGRGLGRVAAGTARIQAQTSVGAARGPWGAAVAARAIRPSLAWWAVCAAALTAAAPAWAEEGAPADAPAASTADKDDELQIKLSLPTESDRQAWRSPGLRVALGYAYGWLRGFGGAPGGDGHGAALRVGVRVDRQWSIMLNFLYATVLTDGAPGDWGTPTSGLAGLRFLGTVDPTVHLGEHLSVAFGLGFGGIVEGRSGRKVPSPDQRPALVSSITFPAAWPPLSSCQGTGVAALVRAGWQWVLGPMSAAGLTAQVDGQWTGCAETVSRVEPDTARPITRRQWWPHLGGSLGLEFAWR